MNACETGWISLKEQYLKVNTAKRNSKSDGNATNYVHVQVAEVIYSCPTRGGVPLALCNG